MLGVLLALCALFSVLTLQPQQLAGTRAAEALVDELVDTAPGTSIAVLSRAGAEGEQFVDELKRRLDETGRSPILTVAGSPAAIRAALEGASGVDVLAVPSDTAAIVGSIQSDLPGLGGARLMSPPTRSWPTFLLKSNLLNVASQIAVIAIIAIGMTMVILTAGIDLSVGSLIALSAVVTTWTIARMGGVEASLPIVLLGALGGLLAGAVTGALSGLVITRFRVPPFIATLAMMQVGSGLAYLISRGRPIHELPDGFETLGRGADPLLGIPHAVTLMVVLYVGAWVLLERTVLGRYLHAVGGNPEAARLAGVPVRRVLLFAYTCCGALAGLGGVLMASQLKSGAPTYGQSYELHVIAAVVVGGTSLFGGEGKITGTLIGALIMGVINNGMNLTNVESYTQKVVLGLVILAAVLFEQLRKHSAEKRAARAGAASG